MRIFLNDPKISAIEINVDETHVLPKVMDALIGEWANVPEIPQTIGINITERINKLIELRKGINLIDLVE